MYNKEVGLYLACISTNRPENVVEIKKRTGLDFTFYTKKGESEAYKKMGAVSVVEVDGNIVKARNKAISDAGNYYCLQISDDYQYTNLITGIKGSYKRTKIEFIKAIGIMLKKAKEINSAICGTSITDSVIHYKGKPFTVNKLVVNDCIIVRSGLIYDEKADLKEDYDMFCTCIKKGDLVLRFDCLQMKFPHRTNKGGANDYRTTEREHSCNLYVLNKHNGMLKNHKTRQGQIEINNQYFK
jgi:hypothetical protein